MVCQSSSRSCCSSCNDKCNEGIVSYPFNLDNYNSTAADNPVIWDGLYVSKCPSNHVSLCRFSDKVDGTTSGENCAVCGGEKRICVPIAVMVDFELCREVLCFAGRRVFQSPTRKRPSYYGEERKNRDFNLKHAIFCKYGGTGLGFWPTDYSKRRKRRWIHW